MLFKNTIFSIINNKKYKTFLWLLTKFFNFFIWKTKKLF